MGSTQLVAGDIRNISITRMKDGVTAFLLLSPASAIAAITVNPVSTADSVKFKWTKALPATGGPAITYQVAFSKDGSFASTSLPYLLPTAARIQRLVSPPNNSMIHS